MTHFAKTDMNLIMFECQWQILGKSTLLTFIALVSSEICLLLAGILEVEALWTSIDTMVNCWCVMLIFAAHRDLYKLGCEKLQHKIITIRCISCCSCNCCCAIIPNQIDKNKKEDASGGKEENNLEIVEHDAVTV